MGCTHDIMRERVGDPVHAWECAHCGHVYGVAPALMVSPPVREPSKPHPNLSDDINKDIIDSEINGGVWVVKPQGEQVKDAPFLPVGKGLLVTTRNTRYTIRKTGEESFSIEGHPKYCPVPTVAYIHGSTFGGSMIKMGWIGRGMYLEFSTADHREGITTSQIQDVVEIP